MRRRMGIAPSELLLKVHQLILTFEHLLNGQHHAEYYCGYKEMWHDPYPF